MHQTLNQLHCIERQNTCQSRWFKFVLKMLAPLSATSPAPISTSLWTTPGQTPSPWSCAHLGVGAASTRRGIPQGAPRVPTTWGHNPAQFCCKMQICAFTQASQAASGSKRLMWSHLSLTMLQKAESPPRRQHPSPSHKTASPRLQNTMLVLPGNTQSVGINSFLTLLMETECPSEGGCAGE